MTFSVSVVLVINYGIAYKCEEAIDDQRSVIFWDLNINFFPAEKTLFLLGQLSAF